MIAPLIALILVSIGFLCFLIARSLKEGWPFVIACVVGLACALSGITTATIFLMFRDK